MQNKIFLKILSLISIFKIRFFRVIDDSMYPILKDNQLIIVNTSVFQKRKIKRGDIVIFKIKGEEIKYIKRVVAIPKDKTIVDSKGVNVNDSDFFQHNYSGKYKLKSFYLLEEQYFVLAENRNVPSMFDSRSLGVISSSEIIGKVVRVL